jgi:hypothetical protein
MSKLLKIKGLWGVLFKKNSSSSKQSQNTVGLRVIDSSIHNLKSKVALKGHGFILYCDNNHTL